MELQTLRDLYVAELKDLYGAERQLIKALPRMADNATNSDLKEALNMHLEQTKEHALRLESILQSLDVTLDGKRCAGMAGLIEEADELLQQQPSEGVLDAGLIAKAQRIEHYEMAGYGTVRSYALVLGEDDHAAILQQTLDDAVRTDKVLTLLAESSINADTSLGQAARDAAAD
jgi:ferritin-like metal-binding protein YciE